MHGQLEPRSGRVEIGQFQSWTLRLEWKDGQPVYPARIGVNGGMPAHEHGLPSRPVVTEYLEGGRYLVEGLLFNMAGEWTLLFDVRNPELQDRIQFELDLDY